MDIRNLFLIIIWFFGFLVLCTGALWILKAIWDLLTTERGKTGDRKAVESLFEEINNIDVGVNEFEATALTVQEEK